MTLPPNLGERLAGRQVVELWWKALAALRAHIEQGPPSRLVRLHRLSFVEAYVPMVNAQQRRLALVQISKLTAT